MEDDNNDLSLGFVERIKCDKAEKSKSSSALLVRTPAYQFSPFQLRYY